MGRSKLGTPLRGWSDYIQVCEYVVLGAAFSERAGALPACIVGMGRGVCVGEGGRPASCLELEARG
jgi:hypothetical protein